MSVSAFGELQPASVGYAAAVAAPVLLAWRRPALAVALAVLVVAGSTLIAVVGSPTAAPPPPWFLNVVVAYAAVAYAAGLALPQGRSRWGPSSRLARPCSSSDRGRRAS
ncbi:hypothetical protein WEH80_02000 [Actinomycetes bacterium KLBMP 9759]